MNEVLNYNLTKAFIGLLILLLVLSIFLMLIYLFGVCFKLSVNLVLPLFGIKQIITTSHALAFLFISISITKSYNILNRLFKALFDPILGKVNEVRKDLS
jgi:hypothetical protein